MKKMFLGLAMLAMLNVFSTYAGAGDTIVLNTKFWLYEVKGGILSAKASNENYNGDDWNFAEFRQESPIDSEVDTIAFVVRIGGMAKKPKVLVAPNIKVTATFTNNDGIQTNPIWPYGKIVTSSQRQNGNDTIRFSNHFGKEANQLSGLETFVKLSPQNSKSNRSLEKILSDTSAYFFNNRDSVDGQPYAIYIIPVTDIAQLDLKVEVEWNETYYNDKNRFKAPKDTKTTLTFEISKSDQLAAINSLAELHLINARVDSVPSGQYSTDFGDDLISGFSPGNTNYTARDWEHVNTPTLFFKPLRHGTTIEVKYNGSGNFENKNYSKVVSSTWDWVYLPTIGGDVEIIVTAQDGVSVKTYKVSYKQLLNETPQIELGNAWNRTVYQDLFKTHLLEYLYIKDGNDTVKLYSKRTGRLFDGTIRADSIENIFIAGVPDPNSLDIELISKFLSKYEYNAVTRDKAKVVWEKRTSSQGEVELSVSVKLPEDAKASPLVYANKRYMLHNIDSARHATDTIGNGGTYASENDSIAVLSGVLRHFEKRVIYTVKLLPNSANLKGIKFRYDSITAPDVTVNYEPDSTNYKEFLLPSGIKRLFIYAEPVDPAVEAKIRFAGKEYSEITTTIGGVKYPGWYRLTDNSAFSESDIKDGYNLLTINVTAQDSISKHNYVVHFKKAYDLNLTSLDVLFKSSSLFTDENRPDRDKLKTANTFSVSLPADFKIENLGDITVSASSSNSKYISVKNYLESVGQDYKVNFIVTSPDQTKFYYVNLKTAKAITTLNNLFTSTGTLDPAFSPDTREYNLVVPEGTETVSFYSVPTDELARVENPKTVTTPKGTTVVTLEVTASNGTTKGSYIINVLNGEVPTGISKVNVKNLVTSNNGVITVSNDFNERVYIISSLGKVITSFDKKAGSASIRFNQKGVYILNGTSGWVTKVALH
jgi:hypothetical protein